MATTFHREQHKKEFRRKILDAAREILVRQGYEMFSMRQLANLVGYSPGSIYLHFKNKEELFDSLVEESFERLQNALLGLEERHERKDPVRMLKKGMYTYVEFGLRNPNHYRLAFMLRPPILKVYYKPHAVFEGMRHAVGRCVEEKRFRDVDVETTAQAIWAAIHGITSLLIQRPTFPWVA